MGRRRCCCECLIFSDDFTRANSDDPGTNWVETAGDVDIVSNRLRLLAGSPHGEAMMDVQLPRGHIPASGDDDFGWIVDFWMYNLADGQKLRVYCNCATSGDTVTSREWAVEIEIKQAPAKSTVKLLKSDFSEPFYTERSDATKYYITQEFDATMLGGHHFYICYAHGAWGARAGAYYAWWPQTFTCGTYADCQSRRIVFTNVSATALDIDIDSVALNKHSLILEKCPVCVCSCRGIPYNRQLLTATWENLINSPRIDGLETVLHNHHDGACITGGDQCFEWEPDYDAGAGINEYPYCENYGDTPPTKLYYSMTFNCEGGGPWGNPPEPTLTLAVNESGCKAQYIEMPLVSWACDPLSLVFEYYQAADSPEGYSPPNCLCWALANEGPPWSAVERHFRITITQ